MLKYLLKHGANINHANAIGCRVVHYAAGEENMPLLRFLVEDLKVDVKNQNIDRMTPLACAVFQDRLEAARYLCQRDASLLQITDGNGDYPLHLAVVEGRHRLVEMLLQHCTDTSMKNERGKPFLRASTSLGPRACAIAGVGAERGLIRCLDLCVACRRNCNLPRDAAERSRNDQTHERRQDFAVRDLGAKMVGCGRCAA